ncbi:MAG: hypothetical protein KGL39_47910 [Patescibacteria group bacterium]|nr:hypothetical protein [Patescibacteria group bacterium]
MSAATREAALADPVNHAWNGQGYWRLGSLPLGGAGRYPALPLPDDPPDGSLHLLHAPQGIDVPFQWLSGQRAWLKYPLTPHGKRMAYTPAYLGSHGWTYRGPMPEATEPAPAPRRADTSRNPKRASRKEKA